MGCIESTPAANPNAVDLSHFSLERVIGQGGFGQVRAAIKSTGADKRQWYAIKVQSKRMVLSHRSGMLCIFTELRTLSRVSHPNLCNLHYAFQDEENLYIVLDLALGGDLRFRLRHAPKNCLPEAHVCFYAAQLLLALECLHNHNILHRDIKPDNVLLLSNGYIKLTDFGISKELANIDECNASSGTLGYMAPEILSRGHKHGRASEWFALGVATHELATGLRPYSHEALALCRNHSLPEVRPKLSSLRHLQDKAAPASPSDTTANTPDPSTGAGGGGGGGAASPDSGSPDHPQQRRRSVPQEGLVASVLSASEVVPDPAAVRLTKDCRAFLRGMLELDATVRLGTSGGPAALRQHPWFGGLDWAALEKQTMPAPYLPDSNRANCDTTRFDLEDLFLGGAALPSGNTGVLTVAATQQGISAEEQRQFEGYAFNTAVGGSCVPVKLPAGIGDDDLQPVAPPQQSGVGVGPT